MVYRNDCIKEFTTEQLTNMFERCNYLQKNWFKKLEIKKNIKLEVKKKKKKEKIDINQLNLF